MIMQGDLSLAGRDEDVEHQIVPFCRPGSTSRLQKDDPLERECKFLYEP
jgi:hypothetical protein